MRFPISISFGGWADGMVDWSDTVGRSDPMPYTVDNTSNLTAFIWMAVALPLFSWLMMARKSVIFVLNTCALPI